MAKGKLAAHWQILGSLVLATLSGVVLRMLFGGPESGAADGGFLAGVLGVSEFIGDLFRRRSHHRRPQDLPMAIS